MRLRSVFKPFSLAMAAWSWLLHPPSRDKKGTLFFSGGKSFTKTYHTLICYLSWGKPPKMIQNADTQKNQDHGYITVCTSLPSPPFRLPVEQHHHQPTWPSAPNDPRIHQESKASKLLIPGHLHVFPLLFLSLHGCAQQHAKIGHPGKESLLFCAESVNSKRFTLDWTLVTLLCTPILGTKVTDFLD